MNDEATTVSPPAHAPGRPTRVGIVTPQPEADAARRRALRRMRAVAGGLLVLAALVYVVTLDREGWLGYVNAGAEASMVGAIADWFAVTALFRHPLGLPIPHTALIPRRKDELGRGLEEFVGENFLHEEIIHERVVDARISARVAEWLSEPEHARRVVDEVSDVLAIGLAKVGDQHVADFVTQGLVPRFAEEPIAPLAGTLLEEVVRDDVHHGLVDLGVVELHRWLVANPDTFADVLAERAPWWSPPRLNEAVTARLHVEALRWLEDIRDDPQHHARGALDSMLSQLAHDLLHDERTQERTEALKNRLLEHPQLSATAVSLWNALRRALLASLRDPEGAVRERALHELSAFAATLGTDEELRARLDGWAADLAVFLVERYGTEVTAVITHTIERWDGREAAEKIELHVGRDLQFIRINGTVVGGLVGVTIHALTQLL